MDRIRSRKTVLWLAGLAFLLVEGHPARADEVTPEVYKDSTAIAGPDVDVQRAVRAYWSQLVAEPAGQHTRIGYARLLKTDLAGAREAFQSALSQNDKFAPAHFGMALASYRSGKSEGEKGRFSE
ncbi:MAG: hypothetical protein J4F39_17450, partial [Candidatus Latescibacteria bacterium]|nr:hypothetical protein [Candidatus Latescibacterota bacterium]